MAKISPLSQVDPKACIADDVEIGPFCIVGPEVTLGPGNRLLSHVSVLGNTTVGSGNVFFPHCVVGGLPQDKKFRGEKTRVTLGNNNSIREAVTIHLGTAGGGGVTSVGDGNLLMVNCHIGHDCRIENDCVISNNVMLAGHIVIGNNVVISGGCGIHHYVTVGNFAFIAGLARIQHDVPPFMKVSDGNRIRGINAEGMKRAGFSPADIEQIDEAARKLFFKREKPFATVLSEFHLQNGVHPHVKQMVEFLHRRDAGKHGRHLESGRVKQL